MDCPRRDSFCLGEDVFRQGQGQQQLSRGHHGLLLLGDGGGSVLGMGVVSCGKGGM